MGNQKTSNFFKKTKILLFLIISGFYFIPFNSFANSDEFLYLYPNKNNECHLRYSYDRIIFLSNENCEGKNPDYMYKLFEKMLQQKVMRVHFKNNNLKTIRWTTDALNEKEEIIRLFQNSKKWPKTITKEFKSCCLNKTIVDVLQENKYFEKLNYLFRKYANLKLQNSENSPYLDMSILSKKGDIKKMNIFPLNTELKDEYPSVLEFYYDFEKSN